MLQLHFFLPLMYCLLFLLRFHEPLSLFQFCLGVGIGFSIFIIDRIVHAFFIQPELEFSKQIQAAWHAKNYRLLVNILATAGSKQTHLTTRSLFFLLIYIGMSLYVLTSTGSILGMGLILGIGLHFCLDFWWYKRDTTQFDDFFLWQLKKKLQPQEINYVVYGFTTFFAVMTILVLIQR
jgi:hypothetical protein